MNLFMGHMWCWIYAITIGIIVLIRTTKKSNVVCGFQSNTISNLYEQRTHCVQHTNLHVVKSSIFCFCEENMDFSCTENTIVWIWTTIERFASLLSQISFFRLVNHFNVWNLRFPYSNDWSFVFVPRPRLVSSSDQSKDIFQVEMFVYCPYENSKKNETNKPYHSPIHTSHIALHSMDCYQFRSIWSVANENETLSYIWSCLGSIQMQPCNNNRLNGHWMLSIANYRHFMQIKMEFHYDCVRLQSFLVIENIDDKNGRKIMSGW